MRVEILPLVKHLMRENEVSESLGLCCDEFDIEINAALLSLGLDKNDSETQMNSDLFIPANYNSFFAPASPAYFPDSVSEFSDSEEESEGDNTVIDKEKKIVAFDKNTMEKSVTSIEPMNRKRYLISN
jgi:hypothetical protein